MRQQLDERHPVAHDEPVASRQRDARGKGLLDRAKKTEEQKRDENRKQGETSAKLLSLQIAPHEPEEFHAGASVESCPLSK